MKILVIGNGGREHAISWHLSKDSNIKQIFVAPGNGGTKLEHKCTNIDIKANDINKLIDFTKQQAIDYTIVGPEAPLVAGIVDEFQKNNLKILGPSKYSSLLEGSKSFSKQFMLDNNIPTAEYECFNDYEQALKCLHNKKFPIVIKADGLAAGKGVTIAENIKQAETAIYESLKQQKFGTAGNKVVIEEFLQGEEASYIVLCDGESFTPLATAKDHKSVFENNKGPNTGGMGAYSPSSTITQEVETKIQQQVIQAVINGMQKLNSPYYGFLYVGLMINKQEIKVLEFNCRLGDPEAQVILSRLKTPLINLVKNTLDKKLNKTSVQWDNKPSLGVVMTANGYPNTYKTGDLISDLEDSTDTKIFHAGTLEKQGQIFTNGGRILCVTSLGKTIKESREKSYQAINKINFNGAYFRKDIGL